MKRPILRILFCLLLIPVSSPAFAGLTYHVESATSGLRESRMVGDAAVEGTSFRMDVSRGDGLTFKDGAVILSRDGGKTLLVLDPAAKTYYQLELAQLLGGAGGLIKQLGDLVKISIQNPRSVTRDTGNGGAIEGYPTKRSVTDSSYDVVMDAMGQKMSMSFVMSTESWLTDKIGSEAASFLQLSGTRTGIDAVDKLIAAHAGSTKGFPLKQITTIHVKQNGRDQATTTTTSISGIVKKPIAVSLFATPAGYSKTDSPFDRMLKNLKPVGEAP
jgi:hypothetical protein